MYWHAQDAMRAAEKMSTEDCPVKMKLVAPPLYVLTTNVRPQCFLFLWKFILTGMPGIQRPTDAYISWFS